jgi:hypothetical protein
MNLADVFTIFFIILGFLIVFVAYWLMSAGLFPRFVERCAERIGKAPVKTTLLGAVTLAPLVAIGLGISSKAPNGVIKLLGLSLALLAMLGALFGSAGLALRIGQGLKSARDDHEPWRRVLRGGIVLGLTFVLPFLGTFVLMPFAFICGFGAFAVCIFRRKPAGANGAETAAAAPDPVRAEPPALAALS